MWCPSPVEEIILSYRTLMNIQLHFTKHITTCWRIESITGNAIKAITLLHGLILLLQIWTNHQPCHQTAFDNEWVSVHIVVALHFRRSQRHNLVEILQFGGYLKTNTPRLTDRYAVLWRQTNMISGRGWNLAGGILLRHWGMRVWTLRPNGKIHFQMKNLT